MQVSDFLGQLCKSFSLFTKTYTLAGTTRKLRNGETDGVDYHFLTMEEFQKLDKAGDLLESGVFEGLFLFIVYALVIMLILKKDKFMLKYFQLICKFEKCYGLN